MESKVQLLEKELSSSLKENKNFSSKFFDTLTENMKYKENIDYLNIQNSTKQKRINELDEIVKKLEKENTQLTFDLNLVRAEMSLFEKNNQDLNE